MPENDERMLSESSGVSKKSRSTLGKALDSTWYVEAHFSCNLYKLKEWYTCIVDFIPKFASKMSDLTMIHSKFRGNWMNNAFGPFKKFPDMSKSVLRSSKHIEE